MAKTYPGITGRWEFIGLTENPHVKGNAEIVAAFEHVEYQSGQRLANRGVVVPSKLYYGFEELRMQPLRHISSEFRMAAIEAFNGVARSNEEANTFHEGELQQAASIPNPPRPMGG